MRLPKHDNRTAIIGSTGSGKTQFAVWLLSTRDWRYRPWIIFDYKGDSLINSIHAETINIRDKLPVNPGIYRVEPIPKVDDDAVTDFLWRIWANEYYGVYFDEVYMIGARNEALSAILTQGRSKQIEVIALAQRPVWANKFVFSEANNFAIMGLNVADDKKYVENYLGGSSVPNLPRYHALWYNTDRQEKSILKPVPSQHELIKRFDDLEHKPRRQII